MTFLTLGGQTSPGSLILCQGCSQDTKAISTVARPGLGWPKGCPILPVAPPTSSASPTPSTLHLLLSLASWKLPAHPLSGHTPQLLRFQGLGKELASHRSWEPEPQRRQPGTRSSPTGDGAGSPRPREAPPEGETEMPSWLFVLPRARAGR